jgi:methylthioribose-1-phosphate isomerase
VTANHHRGERDRPDPIPPTIAWAGDHIRLIDQRRLPGELRVLEARTVAELCDAIVTLAVRGAPALGAAGAMGVALAAVEGRPVEAAAADLVATRPTAVNLAWGVGRALAAADPVAEALAIAAADVAVNRAMGEAGLAVIGQEARVLTHCNTGSLACVGWGTALGVVRAAHEAGRRPTVWVAETRPLLQGSRLTAWELGRLGIPHEIVVDAAAASLMAAGQVDLVVVGADRIAANGDVANKIGTYAHAVAAHHHGVPFYVVAPTSTWDPSTPDGGAIPIERRPPDEVVEVAGTRVAPAGSDAANPAFDVTPAALVTAWVTERGVHRVPATT